MAADRARPLQALVTQARRIGEGDLSGRLAIAQEDEMGELGREMNAMCERLAGAQARVLAETSQRIAALTQLRHADRLTTVGKLASGVAHELGTPLNVVGGRAKLILQEPGQAEAVAHSARIISEQAERMTRIIRQMLDFARRRGPQKETVDLAELSARTAAMLEPMGRKHGASIVVEPGGEAKTEADPAALEQVLTNLIVNAIQAMPEGAR
ncbi:MAG: histidine kinase dimerization/phospho-acceptor domain-containing protein [Polyangiaceae bacterium]